MTSDKVTLPGLFTILYFADVLTSLAAVMFWGDFPNDNPFMASLIMTVMYWILFKTVIYVIIMFVFSRLSKYSKYSENILTSITVIYGIMLLNSMASVAMQIPVFNITPELYRSLEASRIEFIP